MEVMITNPANGRKYKIVSNSTGLDFSLYHTTTKVGQKARNGKEIKNEWQHTGRYPQSLLHGLEMVQKLMLSDPTNKDKITIAADDIEDLEKYIQKQIKKIAKSIEVV